MKQGILFPLRIVWFLIINVLELDAATSNTWINIDLDVDTLRQSTHVEIATSSNIECAAVAQMEAGVFCQKEEVCVVAYGDQSHVAGPLTEGWMCKAMQGKQLNLLPKLKTTVSPKLNSDLHWSNTWFFELLICINI